MAEAEHRDYIIIMHPNEAGASIIVVQEEPGTLINFPQVDYDAPPTKELKSRAIHFAYSAFGDTLFERDIVVGFPFIENHLQNDMTISVCIVVADVFTQEVVESPAFNLVKVVKYKYLLSILEKSQAGVIDEEVQRLHSDMFPILDILRDTFGEHLEFGETKERNIIPLKKSSTDGIFVDEPVELDAEGIGSLGEESPTPEEEIADLKHQLNTGNTRIVANLKKLLSRVNQLEIRLGNMEKTANQNEKDIVFMKKQIASLDENTIKRRNVAGDKDGIVHSTPRKTLKKRVRASDVGGSPPA